MAALTWDTVGLRFYETGVDRGVLYPESGPGVAWNGLVSVGENQTSGEVQPLYQDGVKFYDLPSVTEFEATLEAYTYPIEFERCEGTVEIQNGIFASQQVPQTFDLSYRTRIGNDVYGPTNAYKLHIIYNATAAPSSRSYKTMAQSADPNTFTWSLTTVPQAVSGYRPSAHLVIDSRKVSPFGLSLLQTILYGSASAAPRVPLPAEIQGLDWTSRSVIALDNPGSTQPYYTQAGDMVFTNSDDTIWSVDTAVSPNVRSMVTFTSGSHLAEAMAAGYTGDLIFDEVTGVLYQIGD